jgi:hypothetical protein
MHSMTANILEPLAIAITDAEARITFGNGRFSGRRVLSTSSCVQVLMRVMKDTRRLFQFSLNKDARRKLRRCALDLDVSASELVRRAVREYLRRLTRDAAGLPPDRITRA